MTRIPPPSPEVLHTLLDAVALCRKGRHKEAARRLTGGARVVEVFPTMIMDLYHFANAAIRLGIESHIDSPALLQIINVAKTKPLQLSGPSWLGDLYPATDTADCYGTTGPPRFQEANQHIALPNDVDLDDFSRDQLLRMGNNLLHHGTRALEERNIDQALTCFRGALRIAKHLEYPEGIATCLFQMGYAIHSRANGFVAEQHYSDALETAATLTIPVASSLAAYVFHAGAYFEVEGKTTKARAYFQKALKMYEESANTEGILACREKLGSGTISGE